MALSQLLHSFLDESSDQQQKGIFCIAAFIALEHFWKQLEGKWVERLHHDGVKYFRASDCKAVRGPFNHLRRVHGSLAAGKKVADRIRADLETMLLESQRWCSLLLGVVIPAYKSVVHKYPIARRFYFEDCTVSAYMQTMYEVARTVRKKAKGFSVAYIIDECNYSDRVQHACKAMKINHPTVGASVKTCAPLDDKDTPGLQMADLMASVGKDIFLEWLARGGKHPELGKWYGHIERIGKWDADHGLRSLSRTLKSPRLAKGTLAPQLLPKPKTTKRDRKRIRRALVKRLQSQ